MQRVIITNFRKNVENLTLSHVLTSIKVSKSHCGIIYLRVTTSDKYLNVDAGASVSTCRKLNGKTICYEGTEVTFEPYIYEAGIELSEQDDISTYLAHPNYYSISLLLELSGYSTVVNALKHEYVISFVPDDLMYGYNCTFSDVEIVDEKNI